MDWKGERDGDELTEEREEGIGVTRRGRKEEDVGGQTKPGTLFRPFVFIWISRSHLDILWKNPPVYAFLISSTQPLRKSPAKTCLLEPQSRSGSDDVFSTKLTSLFEVDVSLFPCNDQQPLPPYRTYFDDDKMARKKPASAK